MSGVVPWMWVVTFSLFNFLPPNAGQVFMDASHHRPHHSPFASDGASKSLLTPETQQTHQRHPHTNREEEDGSPADPEAAAARERCTFPGRWEGNWFQSGFHQSIAIARHSINSKGKCLESSGDKFVLYNQRENCYRCVVFHEKHHNVLQYKESFCLPERRTLRSLCRAITGDAYLFSMFRLGSGPVECPFQGPLTFSYNRGGGDCASPPSNLDSCLKSSRLLLSYQACPDVPGTESTAEELECLGSWKEGSSRYMLGLIQYSHAASLEDRFRCFSYERIKKSGSGSGGSHFGNQMGMAGGLVVGNLEQDPGNSHGNASEVLYRVAMSGDATCNGLTPQEGSRVLTLRRALTRKMCQFPSWLMGGKEWVSLDDRTTFTFDGAELRMRNATLGDEDEEEEESSEEDEEDSPGRSTLAMVAKCTQIQDNPTLDKVRLVLHVTAGCRNGYMCAGIYRRDGHILELQFGTMVRRAEDACHLLNFDPKHAEFSTLVESSANQGRTRKHCPNVGQFQVTGLLLKSHENLDRKSRRGATTSGFTEAKCHLSDLGVGTMSVGCNSLDSLQIHPKCPHPQHVSDYSCDGWWEEKGVRYLIATSKSILGRRRRFCFAYREDHQRHNSHHNRWRIPGEEEELEAGPKANNPYLPDFTFSSESPGESSDYGRVLLFSIMAESCHRNLRLGVEGTLVFNVTSQGRCNGVGGANGFVKATVITFLLPLLLIMCPQ